MSGVRPLRSRAELEEAGGDHPVLRWDVGFDVVRPSYAWGRAPSAEAGTPDAGAVAHVRRGHGGELGAAFLGSTEGIGALLADEQVRTWVTGLGVARVSAPHEAYPVLEAHLPVTEPSTWEWMWTCTAPPPQAAEPLLERLGPDRRTEVTAFLERHNPGTFGRPFTRPAQLWVGVRGEDGDLAAVGCCEPNGAGIPHLAGITVATQRRGEGLGAAVTAYLTREALGRAGVCTLGMYADNAVARRLYHWLGYRTAVTWTTGRLGTPQQG